jgi:hypothetical protein
MVLRKDLPRQFLPNAPRSRDGRPRGTKCGPTCHRPIGPQAHCSVCHALLRSVTDFDQHRYDGWCLDLTALGLVEVDGLWATPEGHAAREMDLAKLALARSQRATGIAKPLTPAVGTSTKGGGVDHV